MSKITQIKAFGSTDAVNKFLFTADKVVNYVDLKIDGDDYILIFTVSK
jgi:hypothetical protein